MKTTKLKRLSIMVSLALLASSHAYALPQGGVVSKGAADIAVAGKTMNITQSSQKAVLDWRNFDIARQETVNFKQNASMAALNRVNDGNMTQIHGALNAGGKIFLINPAGKEYEKRRRAKPQKNLCGKRGPLPAAVNLQQRPAVTPDHRIASS